MSTDLLQIPPIRTTLLDPSGGNTTAKEWYFFWSNSSDKLNAIVTQGTHADRPNAGNMPDGAIYAETDRSSLYVNEGGSWHFLAGTMWNTMVPDNRPTDLGPDDAGFTYRTTDAPPRSFVWSGTIWVETTPLLDPTTTKGDLIVRPATAPPVRLPVGSNGQVLTADSTQVDGMKWATPAAATVQIAQATAFLTLTTSLQPVPGCSLTLTKSGTYLIGASVDFLDYEGVGFYLLATIAAAPYAILGSPAAAGSVARATCSQQWVITVTAPYTVQLSAYKTGGTGASLVQTLTTISALWVSP